MPKTFEELLSRYSVKRPVELKHSETDGTNTTAVIVAVPSPMDPIRLVGDEDKHATLMFFGETQSLEAGAKDEIIQTLQKVSAMVSPFGEGIINVERLGTDSPPALVALLTNGQLGTLRNILTVNPKLLGYLNNTSQHPTYTPHVTLGYPDYQGEADIRAKAKLLNRVRFDRLALWWGDEHIEFSLNNYDSDTAEAAWSDDLVEEYLAHHGVKGMKWGIRRDKNGGQPVEVSVTQKKPGTRVTASGGHNQPASEDAKKTAAARQKAKASSLDSLTNQELQAAVKRMQLEQNYAELMAKRSKSGPITRGHKFVKELLGFGKTANEVHQFANSPTGKQIREHLK